MKLNRRDFIKANAAAAREFFAGIQAHSGAAAQGLAALLAARKSPRTAAAGQKHIRGGSGGGLCRSKPLSPHVCKILFCHAGLLSAGVVTFVQYAQIKKG